MCHKENDKEKAKDGTRESYGTTDREGELVDGE